MTRQLVNSVESDDDTESTTSPVVNNNDKRHRLAEAFATIIECIGEDTEREGLQSTPMRAAKAFEYFTDGYCHSVESVVGEGVFTIESDDMVLVKNIDIFSLCEHHMVPFYGKVHIAYIPNGKILGLSKLARIANMFSRRLQVQERLTSEIADAILKTISPLGVGVVVEATHMCMVMRGVEKSGSSTITSALRGNFESDKDIRKEFFHHVHAK